MADDPSRDHGGGSGFCAVGAVSSLDARAVDIGAPCAAACAIRNINRSRAPPWSPPIRRPASHKPSRQPTQATLNRSHRWLFVTLALVMLAIVVVAFTPTLYLRSKLPRAFAAIQASGAPADRIERVFEQSIVPIVVGDSVSLLLVALFVGAAIYWRNRPATHKRLMLLTSIMILGPAFSDARPVGRTLALFLPPGAPYIASIWLCVCALVWHDRVTKRRLEPATLWATVVMVVRYPALFVDPECAIASQGADSQVARRACEFELRLQSPLVE